jgi:hypothetical protein
MMAAAKHDPNILTARLDDAQRLLKAHHDSFYEAAEFATETKHPVPSDTRAWSQILVSVLTGIPGIERKKGPDLSDGSDVKAANVWLAIDTPRFNGVIKSGRVGEQGSLSTLDGMPYLFFVMWDTTPATSADRCRVWVVRPAEDRAFRDMCAVWYHQRDAGVIRSDNFQLHPPRNLDTNAFRNTCGNLQYPLLFSAVWNGHAYEIETYELSVLETGKCQSSG